MTNIVLVCAGGMSTSLLMNKMNESAKAQSKEVETVAMSAEAFEKYDGPCDILLLGPQISYRKGQLEAEVADRGITVAVIDMMDYGMMNGEAVLDKALASLGA